MYFPFNKCVNKCCLLESGDLLVSGHLGSDNASLPPSAWHSLDRLI